MLAPDFGGNEQDSTAMLRVMNEGYPVVSALAMLSAKAIFNNEFQADDTLERLTLESKMLLLVARVRGTFEIRATKDSFDSTERFLAVCVETEPGVFLVFRRKDQPRQTVRFIEAFAQLCRSGLVIHHQQKEFSLSSHGYTIAENVSTDEIKDLIDFAVA
jgi:hypothetical protein